MNDGRSERRDDGGTEGAGLPRELRVVLLAFALVLLVFTKDRPDSWADGSRMGTIQALVEHGTLALDDTDFLWQGDKVLVDGHYYSHQPPMQPLIGALVYGALHHVFGRGIGDPFTYRILTWFLVGLPLWFGMLALARLLHRTGCGARWSALLLGATMFGTLVLPYALVLQQHGAAAGLLLCALGALAAGRMASAGVLLALACTSDLTAIFPAVCFAWPAFRAGGANALARYALGALPVLALYFGVNASLVGDFVPVGLHLEAFEFAYSPFMLMSLTGGSHRDGEQLAYLYGALFGGSGLFSHHPILLFAVLAGLLLLLSVVRGVRKPLPIQAGILPASALSSLAIATFYIATSRNFGGSAFGMRWFVVFCPLLALFPAVWLGARETRWRPNGAWKGLLVATTAWSVAAAALGAVEPWAKFRYFWTQHPDALIAHEAKTPTSWSEHVYQEWVRITTYRQPFDAESYYLKFEDTIHRHGRLHTRDWPGLSDAEADTWVREGIRKLQPVADLLDGSSDHRGGARVVVHFWLAKMYHRLGERAAAAREYDRCLGLAPDYGPARKGRARLDEEAVSGDR